MEFILFRPPRIGVRVHYSGDSDLPAGPYTVVENDEYNMAEHVVIEAKDGRRFGRSAREMEIIQLSEEFLTTARPSDADGVTLLPSKKKLREFGFTDHREGYWYYSARLGTAESLNVTIPKKKLRKVLGDPVYSYNELVMDEFFGQPAYFGQMKEEFRTAIANELNLVLESLQELGLQIAVDPRNYGWKNWPEDKPITGTYQDDLMIRRLTSDVAEVDSKQKAGL